eukprot:1223123-Alexandrium_andersonii.AAC.1
MRCATRVAYAAHTQCRLYAERLTGVPSCAAAAGNSTRAGHPACRTFHASARFLAPAAPLLDGRPRLLPSRR